LGAQVVITGTGKASGEKIAEALQRLLSLNAQQASTLVQSFPSSLDAGPDPERVVRALRAIGAEVELSGSPPAATGSPGYALGDLQIATAPEPKPRAPRLSAPQVPPAPVDGDAGMRSFGDGLDADEGGAALELDYSGKPGAMHVSRPKAEAPARKSHVGAARGKIHVLRERRVVSKPGFFEILFALVGLLASVAAGGYATLRWVRAQEGAIVQREQLRAPDWFGKPSVQDVPGVDGAPEAPPQASATAKPNKGKTAADKGARERGVMDAAEAAAARDRIHGLHKVAVKWPVAPSAPTECMLLDTKYARKMKAIENTGRRVEPPPAVLAQLRAKADELKATPRYKGRDFDPVCMSN
jgi:hypothetical protein